MIDLLHNTDLVVYIALGVLSVGATLFFGLGKWLWRVVVSAALAWLRGPIPKVEAFTAAVERVEAAHAKTQREVRALRKENEEQHKAVRRELLQYREEVLEINRQHGDRLNHVESDVAQLQRQSGERARS